jgi:hypothetical protein
MFFFLSTNGQVNNDDKSIKYRRDGPNYIILRPDMTFTFSYAVCLQRDIACGIYTINKDTIIFTYYSGITDTTCNTEKINLVDFDKNGSYELIGNLGDTLSRPNKLYLKNDKLYSIAQNGQIIFSLTDADKNYKPSKDEKKYYRRKFLFFGHYVRKSNDAWNYRKEK